MLPPHYTTGEGSNKRLNRSSIELESERGGRPPPTSETSIHGEKEWRRRWSGRARGAVFSAARPGRAFLLLARCWGGRRWWRREGHCAPKPGQSSASRRNR